MTRYAVISDVHGNMPALDAVLRDINKRNVNEVLCCGDVVGYGSNPIQCLETIRKNGIRMVQGNHDLGVTTDGDKSMWRGEAVETWKMAKQLMKTEELEWLSNQPIKLTFEGKITMVHGSPRMPDWEYLHDVYDASMNVFFLDTQICLTGHTHVPAVFEFDHARKGITYKPTFPRTKDVAPQRIFFQKDKKYFVNPGSTGQPRDGDNRSSYCIIDTEANKVVYYRIPYDIRSIQDDMISKNYPEMLWQRLSYGG